MEKPTPQTVIQWDYHEMRNWINHKYGVDIDNYSGDSDNYQDFWHSMLNWFPYISNGSEISINFAEHLTRNDLKDWEREIVQMFLDEFGAEDLNVYIWW